MESLLKEIEKSGLRLSAVASCHVTDLRDDFAALLAEGRIGKEAHAARHCAFWCPLHTRTMPGALLRSKACSTGC